MRKYHYYQLVTETNTKDFSNYREAFANFQRTPESATIYGVTYEGEFNTILAK